jgi:hypothetical protein
MSKADFAKDLAAFCSIVYPEGQWYTNGESYVFCRTGQVTLDPERHPEQHMVNWQEVNSGLEVLGAWVPTLHDLLNWFKNNYKVRLCMSTTRYTATIQHLKDRRIRETAQSACATTALVWALLRAHNIEPSGSRARRCSKRI